MEIPWSEFEEKSKKLLTASGRINMRSPEAPRQLFLEEIRSYIPWVEDIPRALWCISERKIELPLCKYCSSPAFLLMLKNFCLYGE